MSKDIKRKAVSMVLPVETVKRIDDYAAKMELNRTSAIIVLVNQALDQNKSIDVLADLLVAYRNEIESKSVSENGSSILT